jgi:hypothetical protein
MQQPAGAARGRHNERTRGQHRGRQRNNQIFLCCTTNLICSVVICCTATGLLGILVCHAAMLICSIVFGSAATATAMGMARNRAMVRTMAGVLEKEANGKGGKSNGDDNNEGNGKQRQQ